MPLIDIISNHQTVAIAGMEKNTGKTECIAYLVRQLATRGMGAAITSIGLDGEATDLLTGTGKPEIWLPEGFIFATSEKYFKQRTIDAEILDIGKWHTATGRIVIARALNSGKVVIAGPSHGEGLEQLKIKLIDEIKCGIILIDGALSRKSQASPLIADGIILCTGAAVSANMNEAVKLTKEACSLIQTPRCDTLTASHVDGLKRGIWHIDNTGQPKPVLEDISENTGRNSANFKNHYYVSGALTDRILNSFTMNSTLPVEVTVNDYTKIFTSNSTLQLFKNKNNRLTTVVPAQLISVCINPWSPTGYHFDAAGFESAISENVNVPVFNIRNL